MAISTPPLVARLDPTTLKPINLSPTILSCSSLNHLNQIHAHLLKTPPNLFHWNSIIRAHSAHLPQTSLHLFVKMLEDPLLNPNKHTFTFVLRACARNLALRNGEQVHAVVLKSGLDSDCYIQASLIGLYAGCSRVELAQQVFDRMPVRGLVSSTTMVDGYLKAGRIGDAREVFDGVEEKDEVLWTALISGYVRSDQPEEALRLFRGMLLEVGTVSSESVISSVISACSRLGALETGRWLHRYLKDRRIEITTKVATALVDMYAKCGLIEVALQVFDDIVRPDVVAWNAMISGMGLQGNGQAALGLFERMKKAGIRPNESTFVAILTACAHSGMVQEGWLIFDQMRKEYQIEPRIDHYGCVVDVLGRAGCLEEAENFIRAMPIVPDAVVWRSLLVGCRSHNNVERAELALGKILELGSCESIDFVLLANIYASLNMYAEAGRVRRLMKDRGIERRAGHSRIEVEGVAHVFVAGDKSHPENDEIYSILSMMMEEMRCFTHQFADMDE
eukprot:TRINITY_DN7399_c0_g1_i1.p1 TRINITY_DN7399_c0_g1~~TRINITY_DN7399_c0_g1_i1.p1  ORF type:complete len:506 (+),score=102.39 TRINITY_DN7399_c0_g1_i1:148-1665(+)